jgi:LPS export ABC transporter protein LptC
MHKLNNIRRFLAVVAVLASLLVVATITYRMQQASAPKPRVPKLPVQVDVSLQRVHYTETRQGVKRWDLSADRAEYNKNNDTTSLAGVRLLVEGDASTGELQVTADRADYHNGTRDVTLLGNVLGKTGKGLQFSSPSVTFVAARSQLETKERVRLVDKGLELEGVGMEFHTQTRRFKLMKDVSAVYRPQEGR